MAWRVDRLAKRTVCALAFEHAKYVDKVPKSQSQKLQALLVYVDDCVPVADLSCVFIMHKEVPLTYSLIDQTLGMFEMHQQVPYWFYTGVSV